MTTPSSSASISAKWVSLKPRYSVVASSTIRSATASGSRCADGRPRLPWASPAAPCASIAARSRQAVRSLQPSSRTASPVVRIPASQRPTTSDRCCSLPFNVTLSLMG